MPEKRLAKARQGYGDYVYRISVMPTAADARLVWLRDYAQRTAAQQIAAATYRHPADADNESEPGYGAGV